MAPRPFIPIPDTIEAEVVTRLGAVVMTNRYFFWREFGAWSFGDDLVVASDLATAAVNSFLPLLANDVALTGTRARFVTSASDPWRHVPLSGYFGAYGDVAMSANVCIRARGRRQVRTTRQRPYYCIPAPPRSVVTENEVDPAYRSLVVSWQVALEDDVGPLGTRLVWVSFREAGAWRSEGLVRRWPSLDFKLYLGPRRRRLRNVDILPNP